MHYRLPVRPWLDHLTIPVVDRMLPVCRMFSGEVTAYGHACVAVLVAMQTAEYCHVNAEATDTDPDRHEDNSCMHTVQ